jgi:FkbM family methyltransferase
MRSRLRESAKLGLRKKLSRSGLDIGRDPFCNRLVRFTEFAGIDTVLDIGANVGQYSSLLRSAGFEGRIISLEPMSGAYAVLERRAAKDPNWVTINAGAGAEDGLGLINVSENSYSSSLLDLTETHLGAAPASRVVSHEKVQLTTIAQLIADHGIDPTRTLLKVDTQGFEDQVFEGAGEHLARFRGVQVELSMVELYRGQRLYQELTSDLGELGFQLWAFETGIADDHGRLLQVDGLFLQQSAPQ